MSNRDDLIKRGSVLDLIEKLWMNKENINWALLRSKIYEIPADPLTQAQGVEGTMSD